MEDFLQESWERYPLESGDINPISRHDAEIIEQLVIAIGKTGNESLYSIIGEWKNTDDKDILDLLIDYNYETKGNEELFQKKFVLFEDSSFDVRYICDIGKKDVFDFEKAEYKYYIIFNENTSDKSPYYCKMYGFKKKDKRDEKFNELHELLNETNAFKFY